MALIKIAGTRDMCYGRVKDAAFAFAKPRERSATLMARLGCLLRDLF